VLTESKRNFEPRECPPEFQERLDEAFGLNRFGGPNFKFGWCQTTRIRIGNVWRDGFGGPDIGYREAYQSHGMACWTILQWKSPEEYGGPEAYYATQFDEGSGLYTCGEFPWEGRYESIQPLNRTEMVNGKLEFMHFELSHILIDRIIPMIIEAQQMSAEAVRAALKEQAEREDRELQQAIHDKTNENLPVWMDAVSYSKQGIRTSRLTQKMDAIEKQWKRLAKGGRRPRFQPGFAQGNRPMGRLIN
jgi:hypothetical protein